jgi:FkbM family methyltransferase
VIAGLIRRLLTLAPAPMVEALRRHHRLAALVDRVVSRLSRPLHGQTVAIQAGPAEGLLLRIAPASSVWISGKVEAGVQRALADVLVPGSVFFDVGANLGFFTLLAARLVGPSGRVVAFEPHPDNLVALRANVELNDLANVVIVPKAVSDTSGERVFEMSEAATASVTNEVDVGARNTIGVAATSIDDFASGPSPVVPDMIKIDVEGHEIEALRGMSRTVESHRPVIVCELHGTNTAVAGLLQDLGYTLEVIEGHDRVETAPPWVHVLARPAAARRG